MTFVLFDPIAKILVAIQRLSTVEQEIYKIIKDAYTRLGGQRKTSFGVEIYRFWTSKEDQNFLYVVSNLDLSK